MQRGVDITMRPSVQFPRTLPSPMTVITCNFQVVLFLMTNISHIMPSLHAVIPPLSYGRPLEVDCYLVFICDLIPI
jgi:hypothetical protein